MDTSHEISRHAVIRCAWDREADVWSVGESSIPGLVTEAPSLEALRQWLRRIIQDLLDIAAATDIEVDLIAYAHDRVRVAAA